MRRAPPSRLGVFPDVSTPSRREKTTMPMPSLNNDSPTMTISSSFGVFAEARMPMTAMGSVGEMSAPNTRQ